MNAALRVVRLTEGQSLDAMVDAVYRAGWVLLEVDEHQEPIRACRIDMKGRAR